MEINKEKSIGLGQWSKDGHFFRGTVKYGINYLYNNSSPFFHVTGNTDVKINKIGGWREDSGGCIHDIILKRKPSLADLVGVHGWSQNGLPELANVIHFYECYRNWFTIFGKIKECSEEEREFYRQAFREDTRLAENENPPAIESKEELPILWEWLEERKPYLQSQFHAIMQKYEIEYITEQEVLALNEKSASSRALRV